MITKVYGSTVTDFTEQQKSRTIIDAISLWLGKFDSCVVLW